MEKDEDSDATIPATPEEHDVEVVSENPGDDSVLIVERTPPPVIALSSDEETASAVGENRRIRRRHRINANRTPVAFVDLSNLPSPAPALETYGRYVGRHSIRSAERDRTDPELENRILPVAVNPPIVATVDLSNVPIPGPVQDNNQQHRRRNRLHFEARNPAQRMRNESDLQNSSPPVAVNSKPAPAPAAAASRLPSTTNVPDASPSAIICPVCYEPLMPKQPYSTNCGHLFCRQCITTILGLSKKCPLCNKPLKGKTCVHRVFLTEQNQL